MSYHPREYAYTPFFRHRRRSSHDSYAYEDRSSYGQYFPYREQDYCDESIRHDYDYDGHYYDYYYEGSQYHDYTYSEYAYGPETYEHQHERNDDRFSRAYTSGHVEELDENGQPLKQPDDGSYSAAAKKAGPDDPEAVRQALHKYDHQSDAYKDRFQTSEKQDKEGMM